MRQHKPSLEALQQAFAVTKLEPEIPDSTLSAYAADRATPVERDLVETMLEVDPSLADLIAAMRAELSVINEPLPVSVATEPLGRNSGWSKNWLRAWLPGVAAIVAVGACGALLLALSDRNRLLLDARAHDRQVAFAAEEERKNAKSLQQQIDSMQQELKASKSDKQQLVAKLNTARDALNREQAVQTKLAATTDGVESLVARALTRGLYVPALISEIPLSRGFADLNVTLNPNGTSARLPVKLSWFGAPQGDYRVEVVQEGSLIWETRTARSDTTVPIDLLKPGAAYIWRVALGSKRSAWAEFRASTISETQRANRVEKERSLGPLEKGVAFASLGLIPEAKAQFDVLRHSHPALADRLAKELAKP